MQNKVFTHSVTCNNLHTVQLICKTITQRKQWGWLYKAKMLLHTENEKTAKCVNLMKFNSHNQQFTSKQHLTHKLVNSRLFAIQASKILMHSARISKKNLPHLCCFKSKITMCKGQPAMQHCLPSSLTSVSLHYRLAEFAAVLQFTWIFTHQPTMLPR